MVYIPVSRQDATQLRSGADLGARRGCAATPGLLAALGADADPEEAEYAALSNAGVAAVVETADSLRLVLAADVEISQVTDRRTDQGEVEVTGMRWLQVQSLFADEGQAAQSVAGARHAAGTLGLADALATPAVADLLQTYGLLWYAGAELDSLV